MPEASLAAPALADSGSAHARAAGSDTAKPRPAGPQCHTPLLIALLLALLCLPAVLWAEPLPALRAEPGDQAQPGDATWPLGATFSAGAEVTVSVSGADGATATPSSSDTFQVEIRPRPQPGANKQPVLRTCVGLASGVRRNLYKTRAITLLIRASRPVSGLLTIGSSNTENTRARDRFFGSFVIGTEWKRLRLPYGTLAPLPGWPEEAARQGFAPGDLVLRPDSVEDICIGAEARRLPKEGVTLFIQDLRFVR